MTDSSSNVTAGDDSAGAEYQSLSALAALALVLSLLAPLALATPLMLAAAAAAIGVALLALAKIRASDGALTGVKVARCALAIALACGVAAFVRDPVRNMLMRRQTALVAREWLADLAEGRLLEARVLLSGQAAQGLGPPTANPTDEPPPPELVETVILERLGAEPLTLAVAALKQPLTVTPDHVAAGNPVFDGPRTMIAGTYLVTPSGGGAPVRVELSFVRAAAYEAQGLPWRIERWSIVEDPADEDHADSHSS